MAVVVSDACDVAGVGKLGDGRAAGIWEAVLLRQCGEGDEGEECEGQVFERRHGDGRCWCSLKDFSWSESSKLVAEWSRHLDV
jgi:hypothetical protein